MDPSTVVRRCQVPSDVFKFFYGRTFCRLYLVESRNCDVTKESNLPIQVKMLKFEIVDD
jgi:hypothetical protein